MKKLLFIYALMQSITSFAQRQYKQADQCRYEAIYTLTYKEDSTELNDLKTEDFILQIGDSLTVFQSYNQYLTDSIYIARDIWNLPKSEGMQLIFNRPKTAFMYVIIKSRRSGKLSYQETVMIDTYGYEEDMGKLAWEIQSESKILEGYTCQKATTRYGGRDYEAWFSPDIPIQSGPYKFGGLPGLIVQLYDTQEHYTFELSALRKKERKPLYLLNEKVLRMNKEKFSQQKKYMNENWNQEFERRTGSQQTYEVNGVRKTAQEMDQMRRENQKHKNNPIELSW